MVHDADGVKPDPDGSAWSIAAEWSPRLLRPGIENSRGVVLREQNREQVISAIKEFRPSGVTVDSALNEARVTIASTELLKFADYLRSRFDGRPELIAAEDTRAETGGFR